MKNKLIALIFLALSATSLSAQIDCRMHEDELVAVVSKFNPFFTDHSWDDASKTETARMDPERLLVIRQKACLRHHVLFNLIIDASAVENDDRFWITETLVMMKRVYFDDSEYLDYKTKFEKAFVRQFQANGVNTNFTFPVDDRSFICRIEFDDWGAKIKVESVKFILQEHVKQPGIDRRQDDGWHTGRPPHTN